MGGWGDSAYVENQRDISGYRSPWRAPTADTTSWRHPGHDRAFHGSDDGDSVDNPGKSFTTRKKHGWWGKEERYDAQGRLIG